MGMIRHVLFTGEIGMGKSTALRRMLSLLDARVQGIETYSPEPRGITPKRLYLRAYGSSEQGQLLCVLPEGDKRGVAPAFDSLGAALLERARAQADMIVIDEIGRLEHSASAYHEALRACLDGDKPVVGVIRKLKAPWADWIRSRGDVLLLEVTEDNRDVLPGLAADALKRRRE